MRRATSLLVLVAAGCAIVAAKPEPSAPPFPSRGADYFPLAIGTWWTYDVEDYTFGWRFRRRVEVTRNERLPDGGEEVAVLEETYSSGADPVFRAPVQPMGFYWAAGYLHVLYLTEQGGRLRSFEALQAMRVLPEVVRPAMSWLDGEAPGSPLRFHVDRKHDLHLDGRTVSLGSRRLPTIRVDTTEIHRGSAPRRALHDVRYYYSDWYAPGVGLVRSETWDDAARTKLRVRIELLDFGDARRPAPQPDADGR